VVGLLFALPPSHRGDPPPGLRFVYLRMTRFSLLLVPPIRMPRQPMEFFLPLQVFVRGSFCSGGAGRPALVGLCGFGVRGFFCAWVGVGCGVFFFFWFCPCLFALLFLVCYPQRRFFAPFFPIRLPFRIKQKGLMLFTSPLGNRAVVCFFFLFFFFSAPFLFVFFIFFLVFFWGVCFFFFFFFLVCWLGATSPPCSPPFFFFIFPTLLLRQPILLLFRGQPQFEGMNVFGEAFLHP